MKKVLLSIMLLGVIVFMFPFSANAETAADGLLCGDNATWTLDNNGVLTIEGSGTMTSSPWDCEKIRSVIICDGIVNIKDFAFNNCTKLTDIKIPESVTSIGARAFRECSSLTSIIIPSAVTSVGEYAFAGCNAVRYAKAGSDGAKALGRTGYSFREQGAQYELNYLFTDGGQTLKGLAVVGSDENIKNVTITKGVSIIAKHAFDKRASLTDVALPDSVTSIEDYAFNECGALKSINIPDKVTVIGARAFRECGKLADITLPNGINSVGDYAFAGCKAVRYAKIGSDTAKALGKVDYTFRIKGNQCDFKYLYTDKQKLTGLAITDCDENATNVTIPSGVTIIGQNAFCNCKSISSIVLPETVTTIEEKAFAYCDKLTSITIPASVKKIGTDALPFACVLTVEKDSYAHQFAINNGYSCKIKGQQTGQESGAKTVEEKVKEIIANEITSDMSQYRKAQVLHNWLVRNVEYDETRADYSLTAESALLHGKAICKGYTLAYGLLLDAVGIENCMAKGDNHLWSVVKLNGTWCHIDVTYDDGWNTLAFFGVTDFALNNVEHHENTSPQHECNSYKISQAYKNGQLKQLVNSWMDEIAKNVRGGKKSFQLADKTDNLFGINVRMAVEMLRDTGITVDGKNHNVDVDYKLLKMNKNVCDYSIRISIVEKPKNYTITVTDDGHGTGESSVLSGPTGTKVTLTAKPDEGYQLKEWKVLSGGVTVVNNQFTIGTADVKIQAVFEKKNDNVTVKGAVYKLNYSKKTATLMKLVGKPKKLTVPASITADGESFKVTEIASGACKGQTKLTTVTIGKNVEKIGKNAFVKCKNLKKITIKTTKLTKKGIGKNAFKQICKDAVIKVPKKMKKNYTEWLIKVGKAPKTVKIK